MSPAGVRKELVVAMPTCSEVEPQFCPHQPNCSHNRHDGTRIHSNPDGQPMFQEDRKLCFESHRRSPKKMSYHSTFYRFTHDDRGFALSGELLLVSVIAVIGLIVSLSAVRDAMISELSDTAGSVQDLNQSFALNGTAGSASSTAGSGFADAVDFIDESGDPIGQADNCIVFDFAPMDESAGPDSNFAFNANFEDGLDFDDALTTFSSGPNNAYLFNADDVGGWQTTATDNIVEIWESGFNGVASQDGGFHAEINANQDAQLFQDVTLMPGTTVTWSVWHRGRSGVDVASVLIGAPGSQTMQQTMSSGTSGWSNYTGTYTVPMGVTTVRFGFESVSTANGSPSVGNFIDNLTVTSN